MAIVQFLEKYIKKGLRNITGRFQKNPQYCEIVAAFCTHSISISIGMVQGFSAILIPQLEDSEDILIGDEEASWLASLGAISNLIGSILSGLLAEYFGRKKSLQISTFPFLIGWTCIGFSRNIVMLYVGRLISGIGAGMSTACYTYVSEISTPKNRGFLQSLGPICASFGIFIVYVLGYILPWSTVAFICNSFALFSLISIQFLPESPPWLAKIKNYKASLQSYFWFRRNNKEAQDEVDQIIAAQKEKLTEDDTIICQEAYLDPAAYKPFLLLITLFLLQQLSGIYTILFYAVNFFDETDLKIDHYISSIIVGSIRFLMSLVTALLINKYGRRVLCMTSSSGMTVTMTVLAIYMRYYEMNPEEPKMFSLLPLVCVVFNVMFSMVGMLPIPWILIGELFPLNVRSILSGIVICIAQLLIFLCVKTYPDLKAWLSFSGVLFTYVAASLLALIFCKYILPETKNKSLHDIENDFRGKRNIADLEGVDNEGFKAAPEIFTIKIS